MAGLEQDGPSFVVVGVTEQIIATAATLTGARSLRASDAVQLATALAVKATDPGCASFACFDAGLRAAALAEGLDVLPVGRSPAR